MARQSTALAITLVQLLKGNRVMAKQSVFDFFVVKEAGRRPVESLLRFNGERHTADGALVKGSGGLHEVEYSNWLRFYSPLSEKGAS